MNNKEFRKITGYTHDKQKENHELWFNLAFSFNEAVKALNEVSDKTTDGKRVLFFNAGLSLELMMKAIIVYGNNKPDTTHNLRALSEQAELGLDNEQKYLLDMFTAIIVWLGRYPAPNKETDWDNYHDNILEKSIIRSNEGNTYRVMANPNRFPSLETYLEIWEVCMRKYEKIINETK